MQRITCNLCGSVREGEYFYDAPLTQGEGCAICRLAQAQALQLLVQITSAMMHVPRLAAAMQRRADEEALVIGLRALTGATADQVRACALRRRLPLQLLRDEVAAGRIGFDEVRGSEGAARVDQG